MGLRETLEAATPGPWRGEVDSVLWSDEFMVGGFEKWADAQLAALAPELAALALDMGEWMRTVIYDWNYYVGGNDKPEALLARLSSLGSHQEGETDG